MKAANAANAANADNAGAGARRVRVGIIDSGFDAAAAQALNVVAARRFDPAGEGGVGGEGGDGAAASLAGDALGHGSDIARIIQADHPAVELLIAQVFTSQGHCSTAQVAAALDWLVSNGAAVVNLSLGVRQPDARLRQACERAHAAGTLLVASAPARGAPTFPAAYPFCIAVSGDARCSETQISWLGTAAADFGAYPFAGSAAAGSSRGGASFAAAHLTARVAALLSGGTAVPALRASLQAQCSYQGPEHKRAAAAAAQSGAPA